MQLNDIIYKHPEYGYCKANIVIQNGLIEAIEILSRDSKGFSKNNFYATPGFVNSHLHPNQLFDRRLLDELSIPELLHQMHFDYKKNDEERYAQAVFVLMDAIRCGATSIYAVASHPLPVLKAFETLGVKGAVSCFFNDQWEGHGSAPSLSVYDAIEEKFSDLYQKKTKKVDIHIGTASVQSASNDLLVSLDKIAKKHNTKVNLHVSEGIESVQSCLKSRGQTPIRLLGHLGILSERWNLIHAVNIDYEEIDLIAKAQAKVIHCPVSNAKTGVGIAPIKTLLAKGINIGLGTDACSNNNTNNIINEAYFATLLQGAYHADPNIISINTLMEWLTKAGHNIIGSTDCGEITVGSSADLLLWSLGENAFVPLPYGKFDSAIIYNAPDIKPHTVIIDGEIIIKNYLFQNISEETIRNLVNIKSQRIMTGSIL